MNNMTSNTTWSDMSQEQWILTLRVLNKYMSSMRMVGTCITYLNEHGRVPTNKQAETLQHFWNRSQGKKQYEKDMKTNEFTTAMNNKFKANKPINHIPADIIRYNSEGEVERRPIGFKTQVNNMSTSRIQMDCAPNRYQLDTSTQNIKQTRMEKFNSVFGEE